jgi:hypothetical protein
VVDVTEPFRLPQRFGQHGGIVAGRTGLLTFGRARATHQRTQEPVPLAAWLRRRGHEHDPFTGDPSEWATDTHTRSEPKTFFTRVPRLRRLRPVFGGRWAREEPDIEDLFAKVKPPIRLKTTPNEWKARRWAWALLYNHPGNLWVGDADDNQIIGFVYATVYGTLSRMKKMLSSSSPASIVSSPTKGKKIRTPAGELEGSVDQALKILKQFEPQVQENLRDDISSVLSGIAKGDDVDVLSATDVICFVEDVAANLELDIPRLSDWALVQEWREKFMQPAISVAELRAFLKVDFNGSITRPSKQ